MFHRQADHDFYRQYYDFYDHLDPLLPFGSTSGGSSDMSAYEDRMPEMVLVFSANSNTDTCKISVEVAQPPNPNQGLSSIDRSRSLIDYDFPVVQEEKADMCQSSRLSLLQEDVLVNIIDSDSDEGKLQSNLRRQSNYNYTVSWPSGSEATSSAHHDNIQLVDVNSPVDPLAKHDLTYSAYAEWEMIGMGLKVTSGTVTITKDDSNNMIGISIGGGAPNCPCLYIVQVFDNTPAAKEGTLQSGDEITGVNNVSVKGKTKVEVAKMIQAIKGDVTIQYNKLHAEASQGKSLDIVLKKVKHRLVENLSSTTADALGLSRAILCNDSLVKKLAELQRTEVMYRGMVEHTQRLLKAYLELFRTIKAFGETFAQIGVREPQPRASLAFTQFADFHRNIEKRGVEMVKQLKPILSDLGTYLHKAIPDTKLTIGKYADAKFEYLSFCLKVKEMDDEEFNYASIQEPLYRVETGNYEYRLVLRCRQEARGRFARLRSDVQVKLELLDNKHVQDVAAQLSKLSKGLADYYKEIYNLSKENEHLFPVEVDLTDNAFMYDGPVLPPEEANEETEGE